MARRNRSSLMFFETRLATGSAVLGSIVATMTDAGLSSSCGAGSMKGHTAWPNAKIDLVEYAGLRLDLPKLLGRKSDVASKNGT